MSRSALDSPARAWAMTVLIAVLMVINFLDKVVLGLVAVPMMEELQLTPIQFGLIGGSLHWCYAIAAVAGGFLANRVPARWLLLGMALLWSVVQLPIVLAHSLWVIVACRVLLGIGEGPATPVATHAVYKWFPDARRSLPVALVHQGSAIGLLLGGLLIPVITAHWGWRASFAVLGAIGLVWSVVWWRWGAEGQEDDAPRLEASATAGPPVPYRRLLTDPTVIGNFCSHFGANWLLGVVLTWLPVYLQKGLGYAHGTSGRMFALFILITMPLSLGLAWASQQLRARGVASRQARGVFSGAVLLLAGSLVAVAALMDLPGPVRFVLLAVGTGLTSVVFSIGPAILGEIVPTRQRGAVLSMAVVFTSLAGFLAPLATGALLQRTGTAGGAGYAQAFLLAGVVVGLCGLVVWVSADPARSQRRLLAG